MKMGIRPLWVLVYFVVSFLLAPPAPAQQTLGGINGTVRDASGGVVSHATVRVRNVETNLTQRAETRENGEFSFVDLPIGIYEVTFTNGGFKTEVFSRIVVVGNRTATVNVALQPGEVSSTVTVTATPLLNQTDITNGYTLGSEIIENIPLGTGSFTQLAILSPGVSADFLPGTGTNAGLGNQNIFANGQRSTSNTFEVNGVTANNLFNGQSSSQVTESRYVQATGEHFNGSVIQTNTSVFDAIGQGLPTPAPESIEELNVNTAQYGAAQGGTSGAHIALLTKSGTNAFHGQVYEYHQSGGLDAAPFFLNADTNVPDSQKTPALHRNQFGGTFGGPIFKDKLFFFVSYQGLRDTDSLQGTDTIVVPHQLTSDRSATTLESEFNVPQIDPSALQLLQAKLPNGSFLIPSAGAVNTATHSDVTLIQPATFQSDQFNTNIDYNFSPKDRLSGKYFYQRDPNSNPFAVSSVEGFAQQLVAGSHVGSLTNTTVLTPNLTLEQKVGFVRENVLNQVAQPFTPQSVGINIFGSSVFPNISIANVDRTVGNSTLNIGPNDDVSPNAGVVQNQFEFSSTLHYVKGHHTLSTGFNFDYSQLNILNGDNQLATVSFNSFTNFLEGLPQGGDHTQVFVGSTNRYYRSPQAGVFGEDNWRIKSNFSIVAGLRWDWNAGLTEKNGLLANFDPNTYSYNLATDTINNIGLVIAGNNKQFCATSSSICGSDSTLTGRQWGFAPRIGFVWSPSFAKNLVVRTGFGLYYDRGEYFSELSPGFGPQGGIFGVTKELPFALPVQLSCKGNNCLSAPFGTGAAPTPPANLAQLAADTPCQGLNATGTCANTQAVGIAPGQGIIQGAEPFSLGGYAAGNKLPYTENYTLDIQWQPGGHDLVLDLAYVGNRGLHEVIPIPFNQPQIATAQNPVNGQAFSYGFQPVDAAGNNLVTEPFNTFTGGNTDLRVPFVGYSPNSVLWTAEGISTYNALQFGVTKRLSHGLQVHAAYTFSHSLDEGGGISEGLFYNGNNPLVPRSGYGTSAFDRTNVFTVGYVYQLPNAIHSSGFTSQVLNGWSVSGITVAQSGEPFSIVDFSGAIAGLQFGSNDFITNPVVPFAPGFNAKTAQAQGTLGVNPNNTFINPNAFTIPLVAPGQDGVPPCGPTVGGTSANFCDTGETTFGTSGRNQFRGPFQTRFDFDISKTFKLTERFRLKYDAQFFNIFNHPSFDVPNNQVSINQNFSVPCFGGTSTVGSGPTQCATSPAIPTTAQIAAGVASGGGGFLQNTIGSPRVIQFALHLTF